MSRPTLATITHDGCRQMALVLEGLAGTLHEGHPVPRPDLQDAAQSALWVWRAGPKPQVLRIADFESARHDFLSAIDACSQGMPREGSIIERSAERMAAHLRLMAEESQRLAARKELPSEVGQGIARLAQRYARNARRALAA